ncbi:hypothetical protein [Hyphomonas sp. UBA4494]|jgi:hypothetical protein|uniref:hypothetical protein n=1 Tax=Hyphomonas sp. UBA4494 TaxID=1946631 RepID=UPI0025C1111E|nr:hypothetical protein [Hyphomonas sp. UBA4494]
MNPDHLPHDGEDPNPDMDATEGRPNLLALGVPTEEGKPLKRLHDALTQCSSDEMRLLQEHESILSEREEKIEIELSENRERQRENRERQDAIIRERDAALAEVRKYYAHLYDPSGSDPDVASAVAALADDVPEARDASRDDEGHDVPTLDKICGEVKADCYGKGPATFIDTPIPEDPDAIKEDGGGGQTDGSQFQALYDQAEQPVDAVRTIVGSASDVSDEDLAEARVLDQREAEQKKTEVEPLATE